MARRISPEQATAVARAGEAARARQVAAAAHVEAVLAAAALGVSNAEIARATGTTGEAVRRMILTNTR